MVNPPPQEEKPREFTVGDIRYVLLGDRAVKADDYGRVLKGQGFISDENRFVSNEEYQSAMTKMDEMVGAGRN